MLRFRKTIWPNLKIGELLILFSKSFFFPPMKNRVEGTVNATILLSNIPQKKRKFYFVSQLKNWVLAEIKKMRML